MQPPSPLHLSVAPFTDIYGGVIDNHIMGHTIQIPCLDYVMTLFSQSDCMYQTKQLKFKSIFLVVSLALFSL